MRPTRRTSYAKIAHKLGAVSRCDLKRARALAVRGGSLEERLLALGALDPDVAPFVRAAWERTLASCERCGRRTDGGHAERGCGCLRPVEPLSATPERSAS